MKRNLFVISESEKERILSMHRNATKRHYLTEELIPIKDKTTGKVSMFNGSIPPAGSEKITQIEFDTIMKTQGVGTTGTPDAATTPAPVTPAPFKPNGYESVEACKTAYKTTYLSGVSMKVFGQNYTVIQKKWIVVE